MLDQIFMSVVDMSKTASIAILFVLIVRLFLKRFPKYISYGLWIVVLFRLLCPFSFESMISFIPAMNPTSYTIQPSKEDEVAVLGAGETISQAVEQAIIGENTISSKGNIRDNTPAYYVISIILGQYLWIIGILFMLLYSIYTYVKLQEKIMTAIRLKDNIYIVDDIISPFVLGFVHPKIYLPYGLTEEEQQYILLHEQIHIKRFDYIIKLIGFTALCIHWFNPLVWYAFIEFSKDMEMSCDEAVVKALGEEIRPDYASSLLALATEDRVIQGTPLAFGEGDTKSRIKNIAIIKNISIRKMTAVAVLSIILVLCLAANPKKMKSVSVLIPNEKTEVKNDYVQYLECNQYGLYADSGIFEIENGILTGNNA